MLINEYDIATDKIPGRLFHVDLYRLRDEADLESIGYAEIIAPIKSVTLVEWPERAGDLMPDDYLLIEFTFELTTSATCDSHFALRAPSRPIGLATLKSLLQGSE